jgi:hypothetical protein
MVVEIDGNLLIAGWKHPIDAASNGHGKDRDFQRVHA